MTARTGKSNIVGVFGYLIGPGLSPARPNAAVAALKMDWLYPAFEGPPAKLAQALPALPSLGISGRNLTIPHKDAAVMEELIPEAQAGRFVNPASVGMYSNEEAELPLPAAGLPSGLGVVDAVYRPACTKLPAAAKSRDCRELHGSKMPVGPEAQAFIIRTGGEAPVSSHGKGPSASIRKNATGKEN